MVQTKHTLRKQSAEPKPGPAEILDFIQLAEPARYSIRSSIFEAASPTLVIAGYTTFM